jgi:hypothetical protein
VIRAFAVIAGVAATTSALAAEAQEALYGSCFAATYNAAHLAGHPGQRVAAMSVGFQGFAGSLLASVSYRLRYGTKFGFSGDCAPQEGGFVCQSCGSDRCTSSTQNFTIGWSGADTLELINDATGLFAENPAGGRDRLAAGGTHGRFSLTRAANEICAP